MAQPVSYNRQLCWSINLNLRGNHRSFLLKEFKEAISEILEQQRNKIVVIIDEASLLRVDVFAELHTIKTNSTLILKKDSHLFGGTE